MTSFQIGLSFAIFLVQLDLRCELCKFWNFCAFQQFEDVSTNSVQWYIETTSSRSSVQANLKKKNTPPQSPHPQAGSEEAERTRQELAAREEALMVATQEKEQHTALIKELQE